MMNDLLTALYSRLSSDSVLMELVSGVYNHVDDRTAFPYIVLGETTAVADDTHTREGLDVVHTLHVWSQYAGHREAQTILERIRYDLHNSRLSLSENTCVGVRCEFLDILRDPDGYTTHGVMRLRIWLIENLSP